MIFQPENFRSGEAGQDSVAERLDGFLRTAERFGDLFAFGGRGSVAPEFGGADDFAGFVERDETVLLAADADGFDLGGDGFGLTQCLPDGGGGGFAPGVRMLFLRAGREVGNQFVSSATPEPRTSPFLASTTSALVDCVPLSMPIKRFACRRGVCGPNARNYFHIGKQVGWDNPAA
jgi:hypothetical protein